MHLQKTLCALCEAHNPHLPHICTNKCISNQNSNLHQPPAVVFIIASTIHNPRLGITVADSGLFKQKALALTPLLQKPSLFRKLVTWDRESRIQDLILRESINCLLVITVTDTGAWRIIWRQFCFPGPIERTKVKFIKGGGWAEKSLFKKELTTTAVTFPWITPTHFAFYFLLLSW